MLIITRNGSSTELPWFKAEPRTSDIHDAEAYELHDSESNPLLSARALEKQVAYEEASTIDWFREEAAERERKRAIRAQRGLQGLVAMVLDSAGMWLVIILTGVGIGVLGAWLDVLVKWCVCYLYAYGNGNEPASAG